MKKEQIQNIPDIRSMIERSSKFLYLSSWAGIMAGIYTLGGAYLVYLLNNFNLEEIIYSIPKSHLLNVIFLTAIILLRLSLPPFIWKRNVQLL
jgi:hypothetical protein